VASNEKANPKLGLAIRDFIKVNEAIDGLVLSWAYLHWSGLLVMPNGRKLLWYENPTRKQSR
jgi:hypothetical protein